MLIEQKIIEMGGVNVPTQSRFDDLSQDQQEKLNVNIQAHVNKSHPDFDQYVSCHPQIVLHDHSILSQ